jgi:hypothetical protein
MDHIHKLNLKNDIFYIGINNSPTKLLDLEIHLKFDQENGSINLWNLFHLF